MNRNVSGWPSSNYVKTPVGWAWPTQQASHGISGRPVGITRTLNSPAEELLSTAVAWWDTNRYTAGDRFLRNQGYGGPGLDMRLGSNINANSNDPTYLPWNNFNYVHLPSTSNTITCTAPATATSYIAYSLSGTATGAVTGDSTFTFATAGSWYEIDLLNASSVVVASFDANTGVFAQQPTTSTFQAIDPTTETVGISPSYDIVIGSTINIDNENMIVTAINTETDIVSVTRGANGTAAASHTLGATVSLSDVYTDAYAVRWSLNRTPHAVAAGGNNTKVASFVDRPLFLLGSDDYFEVQGTQQHFALNFSANTSFTVFAAYRSQDMRNTGGVGSTSIIMAKGTDTGPNAWFLGNSSGQSRFVYIDKNDTTVLRTVSSPNSGRGKPVTHFGRRAKGIGPITDGVTPTSAQEVVAGLYNRRDTLNGQGKLTTTEGNNFLGEISSQSRCRIGTDSNNRVAGNYTSMEFLGAGIFRKPLTEKEMDTISKYYGSL